MPQVTPIYKSAVKSLNFIFPFPWEKIKVSETFGTGGKFQGDGS
jgi:hypothetical protein